MKIKYPAYRFVVVVTGPVSRKQAEVRVLSAFARRNPDGCTFKTLKKSPK